MYKIYNLDYIDLKYHDSILFLITCFSAHLLTECIKENQKLSKTVINFLIFLNSILKNKKLACFGIITVFFFLHLTTNIKYNLATDKTKQLSD